MDRMSSIAKTLAGSAIATSSLPSSKPIGIAEWRRQTVPGTRPTAEPSTAKSREVDEPQPDLGGQRGDELGLGEHALLDEHPPEGAADPLLLLVGGLELGRADEPALEQDVAQLLHGAVSFRGGRSRSS